MELIFAMCAAGQQGPSTLQEAEKQSSSTLQEAEKQSSSTLPGVEKQKLSSLPGGANQDVISLSGVGELAEKLSRNSVPWIYLSLENEKPASWLSLSLQAEAKIQTCNSSKMEVCSRSKNQACSRVNTQVCIRPKMSDFAMPGNLPKESKAIEDGDEPFEDGTIYITDSPDLAADLIKECRCVIGFQHAASSSLFQGAEIDQHEESTSYFPGVDMVLNSFDGLDPGFFSDRLRRFKKLPLIIAKTERLVIRESTEQDFPAIWDMEKDCRPDEVCHLRVERDLRDDRYMSDEFHLQEKSGFCDESNMQDDNRLSYDERNISDKGVREETDSGAYTEEKDLFLSYIRQSYSFLGFGLWTVTSKKSGEIVGRCGLSTATDSFSPDGRIELGYLIGKKWRHQGYALEACRAVLSYAQEELECGSVYALISRRNTASQRLAEKLGFHIESRYRDAENRLWVRELPCL